MRYRPEIWMLAAVLAIAGLVLAFGHIAEEALEGDASKFDQDVMLFFRNAADIADPIGPPWVEEAARDLTALGSYTVLGIVVFAVVVYLPWRVSTPPRFGCWRR
jgi:undecaprenyl-diphosphatase